MLGLIKKDIIITLKGVSAVYLVVILVPVLPLWQNPQFLMPVASMMITLLLALQVSTTMTLDEQSRWNKFVAALPVTPSMIVGSKYILAIIMLGISDILLLFIGIIYSFFSPESNAVRDSIVLASSFALLYNSVQIPAFYKFGAQSAMLVFGVSIVLPTFTPVVLRYLGINIFKAKLFENMSSALPIISLACILIMLLSFMLSVRVFYKEQMRTAHGI